MNDSCAKKVLQVLQEDVIGSVTGRKQKQRSRGRHVCVCVEVDRGQHCGHAGPGKKGMPLYVLLEATEDFLQGLYVLDLLSTKFGGASRYQSGG